VSLLKLGSEDHVFLATVHHIAFDGWSIGIFLDEVMAAYSSLCSGTKNDLPDLPLQYLDYAAWQREYLQGDRLDRQLAYWKQTLAGAPASIDLPTDFPRPPMQTFRGGKETVLIPSEVSDKLKRLGRGEGVTLFMTLLAALNVLLSRYAGQDDVVVGSPIAGRSRPELEHIIGFFVNTLVLRTDLSGNPGFRELLARVRESALGAYTHQDIPFEKLVEELRPERDLARNPIFQVMFVLHNEPNQKREIPDAVLSSFNKDFGTALFDLTVVATETPEGIRTAFSYNADLFRPETIQRMAAQFQNIVQAVIGDPTITVADIPLLNEQERHQLVVGFNQTQMPYPPVCLPQLFEERVRRNPEAMALRCGDQALSYRELNRRANQLAHYLRKRGVGPETLVGLYVERSVEMAVALLGIMKAGAAYVPLDPAYPKDRIAFILEDSKAGLLITQQNLIGAISASGIRCVSLDAEQQAIAAEPVENPTPLTRPENLAYVLYTSGSTGRPKGVQVEQRNLVNFLSAMQHEPGLNADDVLLAVTTLSFDIAGLELYLPLVTGAQVAIASREEAMDAAQLMRRMREWAVTVMQATPATWHMLLAAGWQGNPKLKVLCGGEALPPELAEQLVPRCGELWNMYGPTETTIWSSLYRVRSNTKGVAPIGKPIGNTQLYVLDKNLQPVPLGVVGELYIGGDGVARGYLNRPELTNEKFVADPFRTTAGARLYRTGDLARYLPDGNLLFLGRGDTQVKLRGFRIELGEIESVLVQHPAVKRAIAMVREDMPGDKRLACYVVPVAGRTVEPAELRSHLKAHLPEYMVPSAFMVLEALPLTPNGKVDRRALPRPEAKGAGERIAPRNELEGLVMQAWEKVLGVQSIGVTDNFFELGGHSLLAVRLMAEIEKTTGKLLPLATLFQGATVEYLAGLLRQESKPAHQIVLEVQKGSESKPAFFGVVTPGANALGYLALARHLGGDQPVYRIQAPGPRPNSPYNAQDFERFAGQYIQAMKSIQPKGPYYIGGMCGGARIAFDMARLLEANGDQVALLAILDTWVIENSQNRLLWNCFYYGQRLRRFFALPLAQSWKLLRNTVPNILKRVFGSRRTQKTEWAMAYWPSKDFVPKKFGGKITVFKIPKQPFFYVRDPLMGWGTRTTGEVEVRLFSGVHSFILREPHVQSLARELRATLKKLHRTTDSSEGPEQVSAAANSVGGSAQNAVERFWRNRRNGAGPFLDVAKKASGNGPDAAEEHSPYIDSAAERSR
jgi:surfactin family lipopeptide synthetase A